MTDKLLPLPEPEVAYVDGTDEYGYPAYSHAFNADQVRTHREEYAQAVLSAHLAAQQAEPTHCRDCNRTQCTGPCSRKTVVGEPSDDTGRQFYELSGEAWGIAPKWELLNQDERDRNREAAKKFCAVLALRSQPAPAEGGEVVACLQEAVDFQSTGKSPTIHDYGRWRRALDAARSALPAKTVQAKTVQAEPVAWGLFARVDDGSWQLQHPVRFTQADAEADIQMYEQTHQFEVRPLYTATTPQAAPMTPKMGSVSRLLPLILECARHKQHETTLALVEQLVKECGITQPQQPQQEGGAK